MHTICKSLIWLTIWLSCAKLPAMEFCRGHNEEIQKIRQLSIAAIVDSHNQGGLLFRTSFAFTPNDAAYELLKSRKTYSEFSIVFNKLLNNCHPKGIALLQAGHAQMGDMFYNLYTNCIAHHQNVQAYHERGRIYFERELYENSLLDVQALIDTGKWLQLPKNDTTKDEILLSHSQTLIESGMYEQAIEVLSELISKNPNNKEAYFQRALAYFERGLFDQALRDYLASEISKNLKDTKQKVSEKFHDGLLNGLAEGGITATSEFVPSLLHTVQGINEALWSFSQHPVDSTKNFCNACAEMANATVEYFKTIDIAAIEDFTDEIKILYEKYDSLSDSEKGRSIGYVIGKYGIEIFGGSAAFKCIASFKKLKEANRLCNLEAMALSTKNKEEIIAKSLKHSIDRENYFKTVPYNYDAHNKHLLGHHYYNGKRGIWEHPDPESLLRRFGGKGFPQRGAPGIAGYKETVDFKEHIGIWKSKDGSLSLPTTRGTIHYSKKGAHIVPANPIENIHYE